MIVRKLSALGGIEIEGIDLSKPRPPGADQELSGLYDLHGLVVFRDQKLTKQQLVDATQPFGGPMIHVPSVATDPEAPGISILSTRGPTGDVVPDDEEAIVGDIEWHSDQGFLTAPNRGKYLYAVQVPEKGGKTGFIDGQMTYDDLPDDIKKRIAGIHVIQSWKLAERYRVSNRAFRSDGESVKQHAGFPDVVYEVVRTHPVTGAKVLNVPPLWSAGFVELPDNDGTELLEELKRHILQPKYQYWHSYRVGDALIWDNWRFIHAASGTPGRYVRTMWSVTTNGGRELAYVLPDATTH